jgi:flagellin
MRINTNVNSLNAQESFLNTNKSLTASLEKLSSGLRINKAADDASGLAIADKLRTQASSLSQSIANGNSAVALTQIADKAMAEQSSILDVVKQKLIQAGTATTTSAGRNAIAKDIKKLLDQVNNIAQQTNYNGITLLQKGHDTTSKTSVLTFQMGELSSDVITSSGNVQANVSGLSLVSLKSIVDADTDGTTLKQSTAQKLMDSIDDALTSLNKWRADFGSTQNQLESSLRNMNTTRTNIKAAESVIRDVDYAAETALFNKQNIIAQAGSYAMSQANAVQQNVTRLLQ